MLLDIGWTFVGFGPRFTKTIPMISHCGDSNPSAGLMKTRAVRTEESSEIALPPTNAFCTLGIRLNAVHKFMSIGEYTYCNTGLKRPDRLQHTSNTCTLHKKYWVKTA